jgi:hypothetical protein
MKLQTNALFAALLCATLFLAAPFVAAEEAAPAKNTNTVRPEIGKPIQAAIDFVKAKKGKEALAKVRETDAIADKTPYETFVIQEVLGQAAAMAGEAATAARAFEAAAGSAQAKENEKLQFLAAAASQYYVARDYAKCAELAGHYLKDGGSEKSVRTLQIQSLYLGNDFARSNRELQADLQADEQAGRTPTEDRLQLLSSVAQKLQDNTAYANALEKLVAHYPKRDYWLAVIYATASRANFSDRLSLDLGRLKLATNTMRSTGEYVEMAQLSLQAGYPAEAKKIIDQGYAANLLGSGADADRHKRLRDLAAKNLAEDRKTLGQDDAQAANAKDGTALLNTGFNYVLNGQADKGLAMMEAALKKGGLKRIDDARLHLGYAYHVAGQEAKAAQHFKSVQGNDGTAALARLWVLHVGQGG